MATIDTTSWALLVATAYDQEVEYALRSTPTFRDMVDKHPEKQAMPGNVVTLTKHVDMAVSTTELTEMTDPTPQAVVAPVRVDITLREYGSSTLQSIKLRELSFTRPDMERVELLARSQADSIDALVKATMDAGTNILRINSGTISTTGTRVLTTGYDVFSDTLARTARTLLARANVAPRMGDSYVAYAHPDIVHDIMAQAGPNTWLGPHTNVDPEGIYRGEVGTYQGVKYIQTTRCAPWINAGASNAEVFPTYFFGRQALAEACAVEPHAVVGPQVDSLKRFFPLGWYALCGWAIYRPEALLRIETSSAVNGLVPLT